MLRYTYMQNSMLMLEKQGSGQGRRYSTGQVALGQLHGAGKGKQKAAMGLLSGGSIPLGGWRPIFSRGREMTNKKEIKRLKAEYDAAMREWDRYAGSVFYVPGSSRERGYEERMKRASDKLKELGVLYGPL